MIIRHADSSQLLITQPDHAALAAHIMRHWRADGFPGARRRPAILLAIAEHDNGWREIDDELLVEEGTERILDFVHAPDRVRQGVWPRGASRLAGTPHAAALVAQHAVHVYGRYRTDPNWTSFFADKTVARDRYLQEAAPLTQEELLADYSFLRIGDLASLTFCSAWTKSQTDESGYTIRMDGTRLIVTPDPFAGHEVALTVAAREVPERPLPSPADAARAYQQSPHVSVTGTASGP